MQYRLGLLAACLGAWLSFGCASSGSTTTPGSTPVIEPPSPSGPPSSAATDGPEPCRRATRGDSPVARACREGGVASAKTTMKDLVRQGRSAGVKVACDDCHIDGADFARLSPDAPDKLRNLLASIRR
jgi:hypothetical protein